MTEVALSKECIVCAGTFTPAMHNQVYCDPKCRRKANYWKDAERFRTESINNAFIRKYGLTLEQRDGMRAAQNYRCAICNRHEEEVGVLKVDHDHETGVVRQMLCHNCNVGIGWLQDSTDVLTSALAYLIQHKDGDKR